MIKAINIDEWEWSKVRFTLERYPESPSNLIGIKITYLYPDSEEHPAILNIGRRKYMSSDDHNVKIYITENDKLKSFSDILHQKLKNFAIENIPNFQIKNQRFKMISFYDRLEEKLKYPFLWTRIKNGSLPQQEWPSKQLDLHFELCFDMAYISSHGLCIKNYIHRASILIFLKF